MLIGLTSLLATIATVALAVTSTATEANPALHGLEGRLIVAQNLLLIPPAVYLAARLAAVNRLAAWTAGACGVASLLLWAAAPIFVLWSLEHVWIALSAAWWLATGWLLVCVRRRFGIFTVVLGVAAALDAAVTAAPGLPFLAFAAPGAWKLPLSLVWVIWLTIELLRRSIPGAPSRNALA